MKKITTVLSLFLLTATAYAQAFDATIKGKIDYSTPFLLLLRETQYGINDVQDTIQVKPDSSFYHQINIPEPTVCFILFGDKMFNIWLKPNSSLIVNFKNGEPVFSGNTGVYATYYAEDQKFQVKLYQDFAQRHPNFKVKSESYISFLDTMTVQRQNFLRKYHNNIVADDKGEFIAQAEISLVYENLLNKLMFGSDVENLKFYQEKYRVKGHKYFLFSDMVDFKNLRLMSNRYYNAFVTQLIADIALKRQKTGGQKFAIEPYIDYAMLTVDELAEGADTAPKFKALLLNKVVEEIAREKKMQRIEKVNVTLMNLASVHDDSCIVLVQEKLNKVIADTRFNKGNPAPAFTLKDPNGKSYSLQDFRGKKVYMDLGASWCKPCIEGIPDWNKLVEENSQNRNVVFISLSLDESEEIWKRWTKKYQPRGLLLYAGEGGFKSKFAKDYNIEGIPRFILLDEEGKIEAFSAPKPKEIRDMFLPRK